MDTTFDSIASLTGILAELDASLARAVDAARGHRSTAAMRAAQATQSLLSGYRDVLVQIEAMICSKRVPHTLRRALRHAAAPWLASIRRRTNTLKAIAESRQTRVEALRGALRQATTTHCVYAAGGHLGARMVTRTTRHVVAISA